MQRAKARASPSGPTAKRFKAESSPNAARTRMTQTPKRRKEHNEEEEEEDEGSPVAKRNKASDLTVAPTPIPQGTEEEEEEEGGGASTTPMRSSARLRARTASARTAQASEPESEGDTQSAKRRKRSDPDEDKWATDDILLTLTTDAMMCEALVKVLTHIVQAAGAYRAPTADNESTYEAKKAGVPAENPIAVHRLFMLLYQIPSARAARAKEMRERVEPLIGTVKAAKGEPKAEGELNILRALSFVMDGAYRKVAPALTSNGNADLDDDDVRKGIELLYPRADRVTGIKQDAVDDLAHQPFEASEVIAYLATRRRRTAGGLSRLTYDTLKSMVAYAPERAPDALAAVCNLIASGRLNVSNANTISLLHDLEGIALVKDPNDRTKVRPIGISESLINLTAGTLAFRHKFDIAEATNADQFGHAVPRGVLAAGIKADIALSRNDGLVLLVGDGTNYYNSAKREPLAKAAGELSFIVPFIAPLLNNPYSVTYARDSAKPLVIEAQTGMTQGGALSGPLCNVAAAPVHKGVASEHPDVVFGQIVDDCLAIGAPAEALAAMLKTKTRLKAEMGVQMAHLEAYAPDGLAQQDREALEAAGFKIQSEGLVYAGTPIGTTQFKSSWVKERADKVIALLTAASKMVNAGNGAALQAVMRWLRLVLLPSFNHTLAAVEPNITLPHAARVDKAVERTVLELSGVAADFDTMRREDPARRRILARIHLPISKGGLGFMSQSDAALTAYVGSRAAVLARVVGPRDKGGLDIKAPEERPAAVAAAAAAEAEEEEEEGASVEGASAGGAAAAAAAAAAPPPSFLKAYVDSAARLKAFGVSVPAWLDVWKVPHPALQSTLSEAITKYRHGELVKEVDALNGKAPGGRIAKDKTTAAAAPESGAWLTASPHIAPMTDAQFQYALRQRLQVPVPGLDGHLCKCGKRVDALGIHAHTCKYMAGWRANRAAGQEALVRLALKAAGPEFCTVLPGQPHVGAYADRRPGGSDSKKEVNARADIGIILTGQNPSGVITLIDCTLVATTSLSSKPAKKAGEAAAAAELAKIQYYGRSFMPRAVGPKAVVRGFAQETEGPLGLYALSLLKQCARAMPAYGMPGQCPVGLRYRNIIERFSVLAQKCGAAAFHNYLNTFGPNAPPSSAVIDSDSEEEEDEAGEGEGE